MTSDAVISEELLAEDSLDIAVIGMAGRFPGAANVDELWQNIKDGVESISFFSDEELLAAGEAPELIAAPNYVKARPLIQGIDLFDATFFGFTPHEAEILDPQHRLFIECAWHALEHAGYDSETYRGLIGVFAGATLSTYLLFNLLANWQARDMVDSWQIGIGNEKDSVPTRVSHLLDLRGPSVNVQSACSTSLVAVHLASQSLLNYQCDMALAGGVSIRVPQRAGYLGQLGLWSTDGHCRPFDAQASGMITGDGVGIVVLKRLADALGDNDTIHAIIKGSAVNNDGALKVGYTAPGLSGQTAVITAAQASADVHPESIGYIETHGTGTPLGDSIELAALIQAFQPRTTKQRFCAIGSLKSNIGHLDNAAGVAGLIKTILALKHRQIPPSLHFETPNPEVDLAHSPFYVNTRLAPWQTDGRPRRAGVSAFGIGGTNAHVILEEAATPAIVRPARPWQLLALSAKTEAALEAATDQLARYLEQHPDANMADVAYTYQRGRRAFDYRRSLACRDHADALAALSSRDPARLLTSHLERSATAPALVFMFPGIGDHYADMGLGLYQAEPVFRQHVDECARLLLPHLDRDLRELLFAGRRDQAALPGSPAIDLRAMLRGRPDAAGEPASVLRPTQLAHPAVFVIEYALARLLMHWGLQPQALIGHSLGEYVAACLAGVFRLDDALMLVARRARMIGELPAGSMLAVSLPPDELGPYLGDTLSLAIVNGPAHCIVAGDLQAVDALEQQLAIQGLACRRLPIDHAFHSRMMESLAGQFSQLIAGIPLQPPQVPFVSNVTGTWISDAQATSPEYWARHMCQTVRFSEGLALLLREREQILLEVGPGQSLSSFARIHPDYEPAARHMALATMPYAHEQQPDQAFLFNTLGQLWAAGVPVDWASFYVHEQRQRLPLPGYPFERQRYWVEPAGQLPVQRLHPPALDIKPDMADWFYLPIWRQSVPIQFQKRSESLDEAGCWLVFANDSTLSTRLIESLGQAHEIVTVYEGKGFLKINPNEYMLHPRQAEDYDMLCEMLRAQGKTPKRIAHLWSCIPAEAGCSERLLGISFYSVLFLAQALGKHFFSDTLHIKVVSNNIHRVTGEEPIAPEKATLLGVCRVIPQEYTNLRCQVIDPILPISSVAVEHALGQLLEEITTVASDAAVAYRGAQRWTQTFEAIRLEQRAGTATRLRSGGVYLLIGGLGGIGLVLARHLAQTVPSARLALLGRSGLPPKEAWDTWLAEHAEQDPVSKKIAAVRGLEDLGADVLVLSAHVADEAQMRAATQQIHQRFGQVHGIIHSAGVESGGLIALKTAEMAAEVLAPKIKGLRNIEVLFKETQLDFLLLCSSISALRGRVGQADHCASFAFMDAFAHYYTAASGTPAISVNWPAWRDVGLAVTIDMAATAALREDILKSAIAPHEGAEAFERVLRTDMRQLIVSPQDFAAALEQAKSLLLHNLDALMAQPGSANGKHPRPALKSVYVAPSDSVEQQIADIWQHLLGVEGIGIHDSFIELGGHSLLAVQVLSRLNDVFAIAMPVNVLFEAPTIAGLASQIKALQGEQSSQPAQVDERDEGVL